MRTSDISLLLRLIPTGRKQPNLSTKKHISTIFSAFSASPQLMPTTVAPAAVRRRILLLLLLGVDRPDDLVLPPVVQAFEVVLPGRVADEAVISGLRFLRGAYWNVRV